MLLVSGVQKSDSVFLFLIFKKDLVLFWLWWVFVAADLLSQNAASGGYSSLQRVGFSLWQLLLAELRL